MKRMLKILASMLVTLATLISLCSCGNFLSPSTSTTDPDNNKTEKIDFAQAAENYEKKHVKKTNIAVKVTSTIYIKPEKQSAYDLKEAYDIVSALNIARTLENDRIYIATKIVSDGTDEKVSGMIDTIIKGLKISSIPGIHQLGGLDDSFKEIAIKYLTYANHYTTGQIDLGANLGIQNGTYNLKAYYNDLESKESNNVWFVANEASLSAWLDNNAQLEVTENRINDCLMKTVFSQINDKSSFFEKDNADKYVDKTGHSAYDIQVKADAILSSLLSSSFLDILGVADKGSSLVRYADYFSDVKTWFTIEGKEVNAVVKDKLPKNVKTGFIVDLNIVVPRVRNIIETMYHDNAIDEKTAQISTGILNLIAASLCGTKGQDDCIGIRLNVDVNEDFSYAAAECVLTDDNHADYFLPPNAEAEGRYDLNDFVLGAIPDKIEFINKYLSGLGDEYADKLDEIRDEIIKRADEFEESGEKITKEKILSIIEEIIREFKAELPETDNSEAPEQTE